MAIVLRKKPKPLTFAQELKQTVKGIRPAVAPNFKKRVVEALSGARQSTRWTFSKKDGGQLYGMSQSWIEQWLDCKEQFRLEKVEGFVSGDGSAAIDYGELWHWLLGRHYDKKAQDGSLEQAIKLFRVQYKRDFPNMSDKRLAALELGFLKTAALWPVYCEKFAEDDSKRQWVALEKYWEFGYSMPPIRHPAYQPMTLLAIAGDSVMDPPHVHPRIKKEAGLVPFDADIFPGCICDLHGIMDGVFRQDGRLWLLENKTKARIDEAEIEDTMHLNIQVMLYLYAIKRTFKEWPAGVCFNVIRNPQHTPNKKTAETNAEYVARVETEARKDEDHFFKRWDVEVTQAQIEEFMDTVLDPILRDVQGWAYGHHPHYVHTKALTGKYGKANLYDAITKGDFTGTERIPVSNRKER